MAPDKKKVKKSKKELHEEEATARLSSLIAQTTKSTRKEAKVVKSFECQKIIRKIKSIKESIVNDDPGPTEEADDPATSTESNDAAPVGDEKIRKQMEKLDEQLKTMKDFDIDNVVQAALHRLGLQNKKQGRKIDLDKSTKSLIESMIKHKRISSAMQSMSEKVSDYNAWLSGREDWIANNMRGSMRHDRDSKEIKKSKKRGRDVDVAGHDGASGLFIESLAGNAVPEEEPGKPMVGYEGYQEYDEKDYAFSQMKKKNRPGQRARKAKALAIEAKQAGRAWDSSTNWREKKKRYNDDEDQHQPRHQQKNVSASGLDKSKNIKAAEVATMGKDWKEEGKAHPSWAAREAQKAKSGMGIVAFAGKKITFD
eukprot:scaffold797_cov408-Chaetoceros_neogracile.AAC.49